MLSATINLYRNAYTGVNRRMWLLAVVMLINRSGTMVLPFMTLYCKHIGYTYKTGWLRRRYLWYWLFGGCIYWRKNK